LPTAYWLFRRGQTGFVVYILVGAIYTIVPLIVGQALMKSARYFEWIPLFALIGILNGALAKIILFGWR
jgi:cbb3-type cytochrome oxidase subunit 1